MRIPVTARLFPWERLEDSPTLRTVKECLASVPDSQLLESLRRHRGKGRDDYPVHVLWGVMLLRSILRHPTVDACLGELRRNEGLRRLIGIEHEDEVPKEWNVSRFKVVLGTEPHVTHLRRITNVMVKRLADAVPDLGVNLGGDGTCLHCRRDRCEKANPESSAIAAAPAKADGLPQPNGGRKEYRDDKGNVTEIYEWFGYTGNLLVDTKHEVIVAWDLSSAGTHESQVLPGLIEQAKQNLPDPNARASEGGRKHRIKTLAYDKAADDGDIHQVLDDAGISAVIKNREMWRDEPEKMFPGHDGASNIVYDEAGTVYCYDKTSDPPVLRKMAYIGHEPKRRTLKYRCPAAHYGFKCASWDKCNRGKKYGKTIRVRRDIDLRRFPAIPRATKQFERLYKGRNSVERVNGRLKLFWGADDGNVTGAARFHAQFATVIVAHLAFATVLASAPRTQGTLSATRLTVVAKNLRERIRRGG